MQLFKIFQNKKFWKIVLILLAAVSITSIGLYFRPIDLFWLSTPLIQKQEYTILKFPGYTRAQEALLFSIQKHESDLSKIFKPGTNSADAISCIREEELQFNSEISKSRLPTYIESRKQVLQQNIKKCYDLFDETTIQQISAMLQEIDSERDILVNSTNPILYTSDHWIILNFFQNFRKIIDAEKLNESDTRLWLEFLHEVMEAYRFQSSSLIERRIGHTLYWMLITSGKNLFVSANPLYNQIGRDTLELGLQNTILPFTDEYKKEMVLIVFNEDLQFIEQKSNSPYPWYLKIINAWDKEEAVQIVQTINQPVLQLKFDEAIRLREELNKSNYFFYRKNWLYWIPFPHAFAYRDDIIGKWMKYQELEKNIENARQLLRK